MTINIDDALACLNAFLKDRNIRHELHEFPSGCKMMDVWYHDKLYVVQFEHELLGLSLIEGPNFSTAPDERFYDIDLLMRRLYEIWK